MSSGKILLGLVTGVAIGTLLGVLFAPEKGSVTREKISKRSDDYADILKDKFNDFIDSVNEKFEYVKEEVGKEKQKGQETNKDTKATTS